MRVLVCGGRNYHDKHKLDSVMDDLHKEHVFTCVIHGGAKGADTLAGMWAKHLGIPIDLYRAPWKDFSHPWSKRKSGRYGDYNVMAGPIRNQQMLDEGKPDLVVAFGGGSGTADMIRRSNEAGLTVLEIDRE